MDDTKQASSETSSTENGHLEKVNDDKSIRSYECVFCKRGFTNAQALGGHMNIHRKDKAKVKQLTEQSSVSPNKSVNDHQLNYVACKYFAPVSSESNHYYAAVGTHLNYQMYLPVETNPSRLTGNLGFSSLQEDESLSLQIGLPRMEDVEEDSSDTKRKGKGNEVDLELRLGHNP